MPFPARREEALPVRSEQFKSAMRRWGTGVTILTPRRGEGILGITVSSFCSLSLDPPLVLACIARKARSHALIEAHAAFAINVLRDDQERLSELAAGRLGAHGNRLEDVAHRVAVTGAPILIDCLAWFDCSLEATHAGGDHTIFVGRVEAAGHVEGNPLLYHDGAYRRLAARRRPRR